MEPNQFKTHVEGLLAGLQGMIDGAKNTVEKVYGEQSKEKLKGFKDMMDDAKTKEMAEQAAKMIIDVNKMFKHE